MHNEYSLDRLLRKESLHILRYNIMLSIHMRISDDCASFSPTASRRLFANFMRFTATARCAAVRVRRCDAFSSFDLAHQIIEYLKIHSSEYNIVIHEGERQRKFRFSKDRSLSISPKYSIVLGEHLYMYINIVLNNKA